MPEGGADEVVQRGVQIGSGRDHQRVLAAGLGQQVEVRLPRHEHRGRVVRAGQDHRRDISMGDETATDVIIVAADVLHQIPRYAGVPHLVGQGPCGAACLRCRLQDHGIPCGQCGADPARWDGVREVPRGDHEHDSAWLDRKPVITQGLDLLHADGAVVAGEVDGLAHLGIALTYGLAGLVGHDRQRHHPLTAHRVGDRIEQSAPVVEGCSRPPDRRGAGDVDDDVDLLHATRVRR